MNYLEIIVSSKDVAVITNRTDRYGRKLIHKIKVHFHKEGQQFVTLSEFCTFTGLNAADIYETYFK
jgi:hypothetical protein